MSEMQFGSVEQRIIVNWILIIMHKQKIQTYETSQNNNSIFQAIVGIVPTIVNVYLYL